MSNERSKKKKGVAIYVKDWLKPKLIFRDEEVRLIMVEVQRGRQKMLIVNICAPNEKQEDFYAKLYEEIQKIDYQDFLIISDFNAVFDRKQDRKSTKGQSRKTTPEILPLIG